MTCTIYILTPDNDIYFVKYDEEKSFEKVYQSDHFAPFLTHESFHYYMQNNWKNYDRPNEQLDDDGNWYTYKFWNLYTTNAASYSPTKTYSVEGGHWYRARGAHSAVKSGTTESVGTTTDGIYIS